MSCNICHIMCQEMHDNFTPVTGTTVTRISLCSCWLSFWRLLHLPLAQTLTSTMSAQTDNRTWNISQSTFYKYLFILDIKINIFYYYNYKANSNLCIILYTVLYLSQYGCYNVHVHVFEMRLPYCIAGPLLKYVTSICVCGMSTWSFS